MRDGRVFTLDELRVLLNVPGAISFRYGCAFIAGEGVREFLVAVMPGEDVPREKQDAEPDKA